MPARGQFFRPRGLAKGDELPKRMIDRLSAHLLAFPTAGFLGTEASTWARLGWLLALSTLIWTVYALWRLGRGDAPLTACVAAAVLTTAHIIATQLVLGWLGLLTPLAIALTSVGLATVTIALGVLPQRAPILTALRDARLQARGVTLPPWAWLIILLYTAIVLRNVFYGWFLPPYDRDGLAYHLPIMASMVQAHSVAPIPSLSVWIRSYPINGELMQLWTFAPLGLDKLVDLAFLPGVIFGALALYGIARHFEASRAASIAGAAVFAFTPTIFLRQVGSYNDAWLVSLFIMGVYLILKTAPHSTASAIELAMLSGLCAGVVAGAKYCGLALAALLGAMLVSRLLEREPPPAGETRSAGTHSTKVKRLVAGLAVFAILSVFLGGYAYTRNWIVEGNPIAPAQIVLGGHVIWPGLEMEKILALDPSSPVEGLSWPARIGAAWLDRLASLYDYNFAGSGPLWVFLGVPGLLYWAVISTRRRAKWPLLIIVGVLLVFAATPDNWRPRFAVALLLPMAVGCALLLDRLHNWPGLLVRAELVLMIGYVAVATLPPPEISVEQLREFVARSDDRSRSAARVAQPDEVYTWIERETFTRPATIAYGRRVDIYPLFGADLRNTVVHLHAPDELSWHTALESSPAQLVVTSLGSKEDDWTRTSLEFVEVVHAEPLAVFARK
jgi:hypothetical protein